MKALVVKSDSNWSWYKNFAITATRLRSDATITVRLEELKKNRPVQIVLTSLSPRSVYSWGDIQDLCHSSHRTESLIPEDGDEVAVALTRDGSVYISHNNRGWIRRASVDPNRSYNILFNMEHVSVMRMLGMTTKAEGIVPCPALTFDPPFWAAPVESFRTVEVQLYGESHIAWIII